MTRRILTIATALTALALPMGGASAQTAGAFMTNPAFQGPKPARCDSTFEMQHCAAVELRRADAGMSQAYHRLRARLNRADRNRLLADQRGWLIARDRDCRAKGERYRGGTMASVVVAQCWVDVTEARHRALARRK